jgi:hypothetical protein
MTPEIDKLKTDLEAFNKSEICRRTGVSKSSMSEFVSGKHVLDTKSYTKVRAELDKIAKEILGGA